MASHYEEYDAAAKRRIARGFVDRVREMNAEMSIPQAVEAMTAGDVAEVTRRALNEAHGELHSLSESPMAHMMDLGYPVPKHMHFEECEEIVARCLPAAEREKWQKQRKAPAAKL